MKARLETLKAIKRMNKCKDKILQARAQSQRDGLHKYDKNYKRHDYDGFTNGRWDF